MIGILLLLAAAPMAQNPPGQNHFRQGLAQHQAGDYDAAIASFQSALKLNFNSPGAMMRIGRAYVKKADLDRAIEWVGKSADAGFSAANFMATDPDWSEARKDPRFAAILARIDRNARPCEHNPAYRTFDFWIGDWEVTTVAASPNGPKAESSIEKALEGCAIVERWFAGGRNAGPGTRGISINTYNPATSKWNQHWVTDTGVITEYEGEFRDGSMRYEVKYTTAQSSGLGRMTFTPQPNGNVRQYLEQSTDSGKTWTITFDGTYSRKK